MHKKEGVRDTHTLLPLSLTSVFSINNQTSNCPLFRCLVFFHNLNSRPRVHYSGHQSRKLLPKLQVYFPDGETFWQSDNCPLSEYLNSLLFETPLYFSFAKNVCGIDILCIVIICPELNVLNVPIKCAIFHSNL